MTKNLRFLFSVLFVSAFLVTNIFAQNIEELKKEVSSYENIKVSLTDSLSTIEAKIDSLQEIINQLNFKDISEGGREIQLKSNAPIHEGDHVSTRVITRAFAGDKAILLSLEESSYLKVNYRGQEGYVPRWHVEDEAATAVRAETQRISQLISDIEKDTGWVQSNTANLRSGPSSDHEITDQFEKGKEVYIQAIEGNWVQVKYLEQETERDLIQSDDDILNIYKDGWVNSNLISEQYVRPISKYERQRRKEAELTRQRRTQFVNNNSGLSNGIKKRILNGQISIGMTKDMVQASWGDPDDINRTIRAEYTQEQWIYGSIANRKYIYFEDGILTTIQD